MLKAAIHEAESLFDHPTEQYTLFKDLEERVGNRDTPSLPIALADNKMAAAFYGAFQLCLSPDLIADIGEEKLANEALGIDSIVQDAVKTHSINPVNIEAVIRKNLLPKMFGLLNGLDAANAVIEQVVEIVRAGSSRQP